jgi:hypothetical protein
MGLAVDSGADSAQTGTGSLRGDSLLGAEGGDRPIPGSTERVKTANSDLLVCAGQNVDLEMESLYRSGHPWITDG